MNQTTPSAKPITRLSWLASPKKTRLKPLTYAVLALWFGLCVGLAEILALLLKQHLLHRFINVGRQMFWFTPLSNLLVFGLIGLGLALLARLWPDLLSLERAIFVYTFVGVAGILFLFPAIHRYAVLLLAFGFAFQLARWTGKRPKQFIRLTQWSVGWTRRLVGPHKPPAPGASAPPPAPHSPVTLPTRREFLTGIGATVAGLTLAQQGWQLAGDRRRRYNLPQAVANQPNILFITLDTVRAASLSLYGYTRRTTPQLEKWAREGVLFERAYAAAPWTLMSHASMFTGHHPTATSADWLTPLDGRFPTLAEAFSNQGYDTAGFVSNVEYCSYETGLHRGFVHYEDYVFSPGELLRSASLGRFVGGNARLHRALHYYDILGRKPAANLNQDFLNWVGKVGERPFFAFLNYFDAHNPYIPPAPYATQFGPTTPRLNPMLSPGWQWTPADIQIEQNAYDGTIAYLDTQLDLLLTDLKKQNLLQNTLVIITSDHGEEFGQHGVMGHGNSLYIPSLHVPLLLLFPNNLPGGQRITTPVSLLDLATTMLDLSGLGTAGAIPGDSLSRYWAANGPAAGNAAIPFLLSEVNAFPWALPDFYPISKGNMKSLVHDRHHYIRRGDGVEELYDLLADPWEQADLAAQPAHQPLLVSFREALGAV